MRSSTKIRQSAIHLLVLFVTVRSVSAKTGSGKFQLCNQKTEHVISSFSIAAGASGLMTSVLLSDEQYEDGNNLRMHLYRDDDWPKAQKAKTCQEKLQHARQTVQLKFELEDVARVKPQGIKKPRWRSEGHVRIEALSDDKEYAPRHHYWYIVVDDCSLEGRQEGAPRVPLLRYDYQIYNMLTENALTHMSTDEFYLSRIHTFTMFFSGVVCFLLFGKICFHLRQSGVVHVAKLMVLAAAGLDTASSAFELMHLTFYRLNGFGWYLFDAISADAESMCDAIVCMLLLAIASGWTLPSDVISVGSNQNGTSLKQSILLGLTNPTGSNSWCNSFSSLFLGLVSTHFILANWGLSYNDEYDSYHDLEHIPGKILMALRSALGFLMLIAVTQTKSKCSAALHSFYSALAVVGTIWFQSLPIIAWFCNSIVPFHQRHPIVTISSAILQSVSLLLLSWVVAIHDSSAYHKVSHMTKTCDDNLTEKLARNGGQPATWSLFFGKAKIRLD